MYSTYIDSLFFKVCIQIMQFCWKAVQVAGCGSTGKQTYFVRTDENIL